MLWILPLEFASRTACEAARTSANEPGEVSAGGTTGQCEASWKECNSLAFSVQLSAPGFAPRELSPSRLANSNQGR